MRRVAGILTSAVVVLAVTAACTSHQSGNGSPAVSSPAGSASSAGSSTSGAGDTGSGSPSSSGPDSSGGTATGVPPVAQTVSCPSGGTTVHDAASLTSALTAAKPGSVIKLADSAYVGNFVASVSGTAAQPIWLCGGKGAILDAGKVKSGYVFHLNKASYWRLVGFTVQDGQKGVVTDGSNHSVIQDLTVHNIGDEAIHLRAGSSANLVIDNTVSDTGKHSDKFGEGIYIGSAKSNWKSIMGNNDTPDPSNDNVIQGNHISNTTAESVDIKEGTTGGILADNTFDGAGMAEKGADSWVDVKGNKWVIEGNVGTHSLNDGFQVHVILKPWGTDNLFKNNVANVDGPGYGIHLANAPQNTVDCNNKVTGAGMGLTNATCTP